MEGGVGLAIGMLTVQVIAATLQLLSRVILGQGMFVFALMTYRHLIASLCLAPFAFFRERECMKKVNLLVFMWIFLVSFFGVIIAIGFFYYGLRDTTATYATNFINLIPIVTFVFSITIRVEKLRLNAKDGKIMVMGATLCLVGALSTAMYTGKTFYLRNVADNSKNLLFHLIDDGMPPNWTRGTIFLVCSCLGYGFWFIAQFKLYKIYPHTYSANLLICITASFQSMVVGLCIDRRMASWALGWNLQLITIFYSGALATGATFCLISWAIAKKGPTYPSMFNPLCLVMVAITELVFFGAGISLGSLIGMSLIILGLYLFLWGKNMEIQSEDHLVIIMDGEAAVKLLS
ncbi:hypothetical protein DM860_013492 [Cuscuta australis]|uniref:WAT1-related protein n=1 Tax=Cuscuta australis TaxID=267555 RepID=A0A328D336_9ASTE|nr:hypothetical protein DM860_013492 [Cuscuta australis]